MVQLLTPTPTSRATLHIATDGRTDGQTDDSIVPKADLTALSTKNLN